MPVLFKARPYLALCIAFAFEKKCFSSFWADFCFSARAFAIATKVPLRQQVKLFAKKREVVGILALGPDRRGLCSHLERSWCSRSPPELGEVLSKNIGKICVICRKA